MLEELIDDEFLSKDDRIAVGVSGGADSMLLLWTLLFKQKQIGFYMKVININHHLRGSESDRDSEFVKNFCIKKKIDYVIIDVDVFHHKAISKKTMEQSARELRYKVTFEEMKKSDLNKLFLAHHKNDQAETILMHILRGSGLAGACGIKKQSGNIYRPFLYLRKNDILQLVKDHGIEYVNDSTNADNAITRNYIRNVVIPAMEKVYPNAVDSIFEFGNKCLEVQEFIESGVDENLIEKQASKCLIKGAAFSNPSFVVREYIKKAFEYLGIMFDIESKHYELVAEMTNKPVNSSFDLPHGVQAKRTYAGVVLQKKTKMARSQESFEFIVGEIEIEGFGKIKAEIVSQDDVVYGDGSLYADFGKISTNAVWRFRKLGDVFSKLGAGSKKLNDYFTDKKIETEKRDMIPILAAGNKVLVVAGMDISENVKIDGETDTIVKLSFLK